MKVKEHFLNVFPLDWSRPETQGLHSLLSKIYYREEQVIALIQRANMPVEDIKWGTSMFNAWHEIFEKSQDQGKLRSIIEVVLSDASKAAYHSRIEELLLDTPIVAPPSENANINWISNQTLGEKGFERIIGEKSTLLDIAFLKEGVRVSKAVARITVTFSDGKYYGTGFLINHDLILTNHHVLFDHDNNDEKATSVVLWFDYENSFIGGLISKYEVQGDTSCIFGEKSSDWAVIKLTESLEGRFPYLKLGGMMPSESERVYIIQHPNGTTKQIGMHNNIVRYVDDKIIQYYTDTDGGSSGAPVFNAKWEVVALHQGWNFVNHSTYKEYRNQGVNINRVIQELGLHNVNL